MVIIEKRNPTQTEIVNLLKLSPPSISWNLERLMDYGIIQETRDGKFKRYTMAEDPKNIVALMKNYHAGIWSTWSDRLADMFLTMSEDKN